MTITGLEVSELIEVVDSGRAWQRITEGLIDHEQH